MLVNFLWDEEPEKEGSGRLEDIRNYWDTSNGDENKACWREENQEYHWKTLPFRPIHFPILACPERLLYYIMDVMMRSHLTNKKDQCDCMHADFLRNSKAN